MAAPSLCPPSLGVAPGPQSLASLGRQISAAYRALHPDGAGPLRGIHEDEEDDCAAGAVLQQLAWGTSTEDAKHAHASCWEELELSCQKLDASHIPITSLDLSCIGQGADTGVVYNFQVGPTPAPVPGQQDSLAAGQPPVHSSPLHLRLGSFAASPALLRGIGARQNPSPARSVSLQSPASGASLGRERGGHRLMSMTSEICLSALDSPELASSRATGRALHSSEANPLQSAPKAPRSLELASAPGPGMALDSCEGASAQGPPKAANSPEPAPWQGQKKTLVPSASMTALDTLAPSLASAPPASAFHSGPQGQHYHRHYHQLHAHLQDGHARCPGSSLATGGQRGSSAEQPAPSAPAGSSTEAQARRLLGELLDPQLRPPSFRSCGAPGAAAQFRPHARNSGVHKFFHSVKSRCGVIFSPSRKDHL